MIKDLLIHTIVLAASHTAVEWAPLQAVLPLRDYRFSMWYEKENQRQQRINMSSLHFTKSLPISPRYLSFTKPYVRSILLSYNGHLKFFSEEVSVSWRMKSVQIPKQKHWHICKKVYNVYETIIKINHKYVIHDNIHLDQERN